MFSSSCGRGPTAPEAQHLGMGLLLVSCEVAGDPENILD